MGIAYFFGGVLVGVIIVGLLNILPNWSQDRLVGGGDPYTEALSPNRGGKDDNSQDLVHYEWH